MKKISWCCILAALFTCSVLNSIAQSSAMATVAATIVNPIEIDKTIDMNFGNVAIGTTQGVVVLTPSGTRSWNGGVTLPNVTGTVAPATFNVSGVPGMTYSIILPGNELVLANGTETMTVGLFSSDPPDTGIIGPSGSQTLSVGATLNVGPSQPLGLYTGVNPFEVTVNYN